MLKLKAFRSQAKGLTDFLQPACMLDENTLLLKSGALMTAFAYSGRDVESSTEDEINALAYASDHVLSQIGSGWCSYHDACRLETSAYLQNTRPEDFPDPVTQAIELERIDHFQAKDTVYENYYVLTLIWMPPSLAANKVQEMVYSTDGEKAVVTAADRNLAFFNTSVTNIVEQLGNQLAIRRLGEYEMNVDGESVICHELLEHLNFTIVGRNHAIALPDRAMYIDSVVGGYDMYSGVVPKVDSTTSRSYQSTASLQRATRRCCKGLMSSRSSIDGRIALSTSMLSKRKGRYQSTEGSGNRRSADGKTR